MNSLCSVDELRREGRRLVVVLPDGSLLPATLDATPAGVVVQFNGSQLRLLDDPVRALRDAVGCLQKQWADVSLPRLDWAVQRKHTATLGAEVLDAALQLGFADGGANKMLLIVGTSGVTHRRYWASPAQVQSASSRRCGIDEIELHVYTAHDENQQLYWRIECREYLFSRAPLIAPHPVTMSLLRDVGLGVIEQPRVERIASARQDERNAKRAVGLLVGSEAVTDNLVLQAFAEIYGVPKMEQLVRSDRLSKIFSKNLQKQLDTSEEISDRVGSGCLSPGQRELRRSDDLKPCRVETE